MEQAKALTKKLYYHSLIRYIVIGGVTFLMDFLLLVLLHGVLDVNVLIAASLSYWTAIAFNFVANRFWTFGATDTPVIKHLIAYLLLLGFNYLFTVAFIGIATNLDVHYTVAKIVSVAIQTSWTYALYKKVIFV
jgi:putative flippase GtrA